PWFSVASGVLTVSFAMSLVWIGALLDGSAWGTASDAPWALGSGQYNIFVTLAEFGPVAVFDPAIPATYTIHPVQAYFALGCLLIGVAGIFLTRRLPPRPYSAVLVGALALLWLGLGYLRADDPVFVLSLRAPQIMALAGVIWSITVLSTGRNGGSR
ncbi:prolipoprotein diacylglyceryl transferase, partial [bacterium]|nr:prolipoprotein diacylglyceryl transferase [bacterium]